MVREKTRFLCSVAHLTPERHTGLVSPAPLCGCLWLLRCCHLGAAIKHHPVISNMLIDTKNFRVAGEQRKHKSWHLKIEHSPDLVSPTQNPKLVDRSQPSCTPQWCDWTQTRRKPWLRCKETKTKQEQTIIGNRFYCRGGEAAFWPQSPEKRRSKDIRQLVTGCLRRTLAHLSK